MTRDNLIATLAEEFIHTHGVSQRLGRHNAARLVDLMHSIRSEERQAEAPDKSILLPLGWRVTAHADGSVTIAPIEDKTP